MSSSKIVFLLILTSISFIDFLPCVHCQLPNIYDLTWFDSFSLENYEGLFNSQDTKLHDASNLDEKIVNSNNGYEKSKKTTEETTSQLMPHWRKVAILIVVSFNKVIGMKQLFIFLSNKAVK